MLSALLSDEPRLSGVVAERPEVAAEADRTFASQGLSARARGVGADFFEQVPGGGDVYTLANVLHDWSDDDSVSILRTVRAAMTPAARLWVVEQVLDAPGRSPDQRRDLDFVDLHMLVMFGARERTHAEYDVLLDAAGFGASTLLATGSTWNVLEARPR